MNTFHNYLKSSPQKGFKSLPFYSKDGDFLTYYVDGSDHYEERIDNVLTVYRSFDSDELVGFKIKGVRILLRKANESRFDVYEADKLKVQLLISAGVLFDGSDTKSMEIYRYFLERTKDVTITNVWQNSYADLSLQEAESAVCA